MRIMAVDYGDARIGLAVSDLTGTLAGEAWMLPEWDATRAVQRIAQEAAARGVERLVLGLPKNMDGSEGARAEKSRWFAALLEQESGLPVTLWDERLTTVDSHRILHENGRRAKKHRDHVDAVAASLILESFLRAAH